MFRRGEKMKAVLFDMEGVLVDTEKYYRDYWKKAAEDLGYSTTTAAATAT